MDRMQLIYKLQNLENEVGSLKRMLRESERKLELALNNAITYKNDNNLHVISYEMKYKDGEVDVEETAKGMVQGISNLFERICK